MLFTLQGFRKQLRFLQRSTLCHNGRGISGFQKPSCGNQKWEWEFFLHPHQVYHKGNIKKGQKVLSIIHFKHEKNFNQYSQNSVIHEFNNITMCKTNILPFLLVRNSNFFGSNVSRLILIDLSPASCSWGNFLFRVMAFVVRANVSRPSKLLSSARIKQVIVILS